MTIPEPLLLVHDAHSAPVVPRALTEDPWGELMNAIIDRDGNVLAEASLRFSDDGRNLVAESVQRGSRLVRYYFQDGGRQVIVFLDHEQLRGRLATRWTHGRRTWVVRLETPASVPALPVPEEAIAFR